MRNGNEKFHSEMRSGLDHLYINHLCVEDMCLRVDSDLTLRVCSYLYVDPSISTQLLLTIHINCGYYSWVMVN